MQCGTLEELRARNAANNSVRIKYKERAQGMKEQLVTGCAQFAKVVEDQNGWLTFQIQQEQDVAHILRIFHELKTDVYRIEMNEKSLEDIFIGDEYSA